MKYCPQCNRQYNEVWLTFCSDDGSLLIEELSPPVDPNWDPKIREPKVTTASEQETQWLARDAPLPRAGGGAAGRPVPAAVGAPRRRPADVTDVAGVATAAATGATCRPTKSNAGSRFDGD